MARSVLNLFFICAFLSAFYSSAFNITGPVLTTVNAPDNVPVNWTWFEGDPTNIVVNLFMNNVSDVCTFGRAYPVTSKGIRHYIDGMQEADGRKFGNFSFKANDTGQYILCAYEDITPPNGTLNFRSVANSTAFNVTNTTTTIEMPPPFTPTPTASKPPSTPTGGAVSTAGHNTPSNTPENNSKLSTGALAGAIVGGVLFAIVLIAFILFFFAGRLFFPWMVTARKKFYSKVSHAPPKDK